MYKIYTDGACSGNPGPGGAAFVVFDEQNKELTRQIYSDKSTTNQKMELLAILRACEHYKSHLEENGLAIIYSDSAYCINCYKQKWYKKWEVNGWVNSKKQPVANKDLWEQIIPFFKNNNLNFEKVKGHSNDENNVLVDKLAVFGRDYVKGD